MDALRVKDNIENKLDGRADRDIRNKKLHKEADEVVFYVTGHFHRKEAIKVLKYALKSLEKL
ncbi:hypothetical protein [Apilactobacillus xinyiensis]|uniref:hypothetical protein n=1 Tax=Apilactobacillus xinyiensis TaxID=2841032 RepID=UPI001C7D59E8|nr:hypothetical protein [Apilactobacillus xinyiensis]